MYADIGKSFVFSAAIFQFLGMGEFGFFAGSVSAVLTYHFWRNECLTSTQN